MGLHRFSEARRFPISQQEAWDFFSDPRNLAVITPPEMGFVIQGDLPERVHPGLIVQYRVRPVFNVPVNWVTEITHVVPGELFVDEQRFGPYRFWHHQHHFRPVEGGVEMRDIVHYDVGFGPIGNLVNLAVVRSRIRGIFDFRQRVLEQRFGSLPEHAY
ncbi:MAG: SRPBCC family protein [Dehalococcoidia bacterium]